METKCFRCENNVETISRRAKQTADFDWKSGSGVCLPSKKIATYTIYFPDIQIHRAKGVCFWAF